MHLIDDIDFITRRHRAITHLFYDFANIINTGVRGRIYFNDIDMTAVDDCLTMLTKLGYINGRLLNIGGLISDISRESR